MFYSKHMINFERCTLMGFGRGLVATEHPDGSVTYEPSDQTVSRADEMGQFWEKHAGRVGRIVCSGGWPGAAQKMSRPPGGSSEGEMMRDRLVHHWGVPGDLVVFEGESERTAANFYESLRAKLIHRGEFTPGHPLIVAVSELHQWRVGQFATSVLAVVPGKSLLRLEPKILELTSGGGEALAKKEKAMAVVTEMALRQVGDFDSNGVPADEYALRISKEFRSLWPHQETLAPRFMEDNLNWKPPEIPILEYA